MRGHVNLVTQVHREKYRVCNKAPSVLDRIFLVSNRVPFGTIYTTHGIKLNATRILGKIITLTTTNT